MRICYICSDPGVPVFGRKGCSTHVRETCLTLIEMGHDLRLICANIEGDDDERDLIPIVKVDPPRSRKLGFDLRHAIADRRVERAAERLFGRWRPEAIYERYSLYSRAGTRLAHRYGLPHLLEVNSVMTREQKERIKLGPLARFIERRIFSRARHVAILSEPLRGEVIARRGHGRAITRMPMAVNLNRFSPEVDGAPVREKLRLGERFAIGYLGTLTEWHGISMLHDLARTLDERGASDCVILVVGGDDRRVEAHRQKVAERGYEDTLRFIGPVAHREAPAYLRAMDVALVPDTTYWSSPAKLFEYQGCGVASIAPRYPAVLTAMDHGVEGLIFEPNEVEQLADMVLLLRANPELRLEMGRRARARAERDHSWESHARGVIEIFKGQRRGDAAAA
jgi:glycosyltransferase involved in cell wall biosynthesis